MLQPFRCKPIYKEKVWGGRWLSEYFGRDLPAEVPIGESWELACRADAMSEIMDGPFAGHSFLELAQSHPAELLGRWVLQQGITPFPLLIKFLDANNRLSVQVHPDDLNAQPGELGKTEMWYVLAAEPTAKLIMGVQEGVTSEEFATAIQQGQLHKYLIEVPARPGDAFYIPAGTVHAILEGVRVVEIQQNSDTTYRIYDWNRLGFDGNPRQLHITEALNVIDFTKQVYQPHQGIELQAQGWQRRILTASRYFLVEEMKVQQLVDYINPQRFEVWMILEGMGQLTTDFGIQTLYQGETWIIPAITGQYQLTGPVKILCSFIPNLEQEIVMPLQKQGYTLGELADKIGGFDISDR